jgi:hypothetical protein
MIFDQSKLPYFQGMRDVYVLDKPKPGLSGLKDATKDLWLNRGYGVTNWRQEGTNNWDVLIGELADVNGKIKFNLSELKKIWGNKGAKHLESHVGAMVNRGQLRRDGISTLGSSLYQLTLTPERQPSDSPDYVTIPLIQYEATPHCYCSTTYRDVMYLGCKTCRTLVLAVIKSYYKNFWLEIEEAVTKRENQNAPARFDQSKVPQAEREMMISSIGMMLHLCSKSTPVLKKVDTTRLFFLVSDANNRIHINPKSFPDHRDTIPQVSRYFIEENKLDDLENSGKTKCWNCDAINSKKGTFCSSCGSRMNPLADPPSKW